MAHCNRTSYHRAYKFQSNSLNFWLCIAQFGTQLNIPSPHILTEFCRIAHSFEVDIRLRIFQYQLRKAFAISIRTWSILNFALHTLAQTCTDPLQTHLQRRAVIRGLLSQLLIAHFLELALQHPAHHYYLYNWLCSSK